MGSVQQIKVKWNNHQSNFTKVFDDLLLKKEFVDVTLACEGQSLKAHKVVLSACSPYFRTLFLENPCKHPIVLMRDFRFCEIEAVIEYMYKGEVNIARESLREFLRTAQTLQVKGLADDDSGETNDGETVNSAYIPQIQDRVPDVNTEIRPQSRISRPSAAEKTSISQDSFSQSQPSPAVSREHFSTPKHDSFSHPAPKRMRVSEKTHSIPPQSVVENRPSQPITSYQAIPEIPSTNPGESSSDGLETAVKVEMKPFEVVDFENPHEPESILEESPDIGLDSPEPDTIVLGDEPEILEDEQELMFSHDGTSQEGGLSQDSLTSNLISALRDAGAGQSMSSPQASGEGYGTFIASKSRNKRNMVWKYFEEAPHTVSRVMCYLCGTKVGRGFGGSPYGLVKHLMNRHRQQYMELHVLTAQRNN